MAFLNTAKPAISFFVPKRLLESIPTSEGEFLTWPERERFHGVASWIVLTFLRLNAAGFPVAFCQHMPTSGIVLTHSRVLREEGGAAPPGVLFVCVEGDRGRCWSGDVHIVQNPNQERRNWFWKRFYVPYWTQPGLVARRVERGGAFQNVGYMGNQFNLVPECHEERWRTSLSDLGLAWRPYFSPRQWGDYEELDAIVAVRDYHQHWNDAWKPANKLFNAWHGGVIPLLGPETSVVHHGSDGDDCFICRSSQEVLGRLTWLRDHPDERERIRANIARRRLEIDDAAILATWRELFETVLLPEYDRMVDASPSRRALDRAISAGSYGLDWADRWRRYAVGRARAAIRGEEFRGFL